MFEDLLDCKRLLREVKLLRCLNNPYTVKLHDVRAPGVGLLGNHDKLFLVMEFCESDLQKLLIKAMYLKELHVKTIIYSLLCGLRYLHAAKIIHRDIKPGNVLLKEDCSVRICDFGLARSLVGVQSLTATILSQELKVISDGMDS